MYIKWNGLQTRGCHVIYYNSLSKSQSDNNLLTLSVLSAVLASWRQFRFPTSLWLSLESRWIWPICTHSKTNHLPHMLRFQMIDSCMDTPLRPAFAVHYRRVFLFGALRIFPDDFGILVVRFRVKNVLCFQFLLQYLLWVCRRYRDHHCWTKER